MVHINRLVCLLSLNVDVGFIFFLFLKIGGTKETRTLKAAFTTRRISNPLQYHYGTVPYILCSREASNLHGFVKLCLQPDPTV